MRAKAQIAKWTTVMATVAFALCARAASYEVVSEADVIALTGAIGGDEIRKIDNGNGTHDIIHIFTSTDAAATFTVPAANGIVAQSAKVLVVGGGAGGSGNCGGGGGAGGLIYKEGLTLNGGAYSVTVGAGGAKSANASRGNNGSDSILVLNGNRYVALGGGTGGKHYNTNPAEDTALGNGDDGGSGGGGGRGGTPGAGLQPESESGGYGNAGGLGYSTNIGGGGGGAGSAGVAATSSKAGDGGEGLEYDISGESAYYAAGGGGAHLNNGGQPGLGGSGIGGDGLKAKGSTEAAGTAGAGQPGTGSGGGGASGGDGTWSIGGAGGSGTVIIRYTVEPADVGATASSITTHNGEKIYSFTGTDNVNYLTLSGLVKADILVVGGGGAGANAGAATARQGGAGGGGAGGFVTAEGIYLEGGTYTITVGKGGVNADATQGAGANGESSTIVLNGTTKYEAVGGGGGGIKAAGNAGGSGGGGSKDAGGAATAGQGFAGGTGSHNRSGAGGGGAGGIGGSSVNVDIGGTGGAGLASSITGAEVYYAAGGGGGTRTGTAAAVGGSGIGGSGGYADAAATAGRDGTGSGGGGSSQNTVGGAGGSGIVIIRIKAIMPAKPETAYEFAYDGNEHTLYEGASGVAITDGDGNTVDKITVKDVGTYNYTVSLADAWKWADGSDNTPVNVTVKVNPPALVVESITVTPWQVGQTPSKPVVVTSPFQLKEGEYTVVYAASEAGPWSATPPTEAGTCWVTVEIPDSENYSSPAAGTIPKVSVDLWDFPATEGVKLIDSLGYHVELTIKHEGAALTNFPMLVKFSENSPEGFEYKYANPDGSDIRFYAADGTQLAFEVDTWNPEGESLFWVNVPVYENGAVITAWWGELVDKKPDALVTDALSKVWSEFAGVWHMKDAVNSRNGGKGTIHASSVETDGILGKAYAKKSGGSQGPIMRADDTKSIADLYNAMTNTSFAISGWINQNALPSQYSMLFSQRTEGPATSSHDAWAVFFPVNNSSASIRSVYKDNNGGTYYYTATKLSLPIEEWHHVVFVFAKPGNEGAVWVNGEKEHSYTSTINFARQYRAVAFGGLSGTANSFAFNGAMDEIRFKEGTPPDEWFVAEYKQVAGGAYDTSRTFVTPGAHFKNRWLVEPSITKTEWMEGETPAEASAGIALYGEAYYTFESVGVTITNDVPTAMGGYVFKGVVDGLQPVADGPYGYEGLMSSELDVGILNTSPYDSLNGTASGRVLLANDHGDGEGAVTGQAYSNTDPANGSGSYWVHNETIANNELYPYLKLSSESELLSVVGLPELCGSKSIWYLDNTRIGNWYEEGCYTDATRNYLPWSTDAKPNGVQAESSHLVMRNIADAAIYSPCYTNGIGTIYFDAVNALTNGLGSLVVEICTNTTTGLDVPSDENIEKRIPTRWEADVDEDGNAILDENGTPMTTEIPGETNRYGYAVWMPIKVKVLKKEGSAVFDEPYETEEIALEIKKGGSYENFYRVYAELNYTGPIRFRIRRTEADATANIDAGLILVDNVIASYPSMRADLSSYGEFDGDKGGKHVLGFKGAFNVPLPSVKDVLYGRGKVKYSVNNGLADADVSKFVISSRMFYRWRYLDQKVSDWKSVALDHSVLVDGGFKSPATMDLAPNIPGDLEYYYVSWLNAPFYDYVDYSGTGLKLGGHYTENTSVVTNRFDSPVTLESRGTDWFVRLREGRSDYEVINLIVSEQIDDDWEDTVYKTNTIPMELIGNGVWRGVYQTLEANPNGIKYRFEARNRQTAGTSEWNISTNYWSVSRNWDSFPVTDVVAEAATNDWSSLPNDGVTGYLLFQLDDTTRAITIVHADYQNFNAWNDANKPSKLFVGSSTEDEGKTGASPKAVSHDGDFSQWRHMPKTNVPDDRWREFFNTSAGLDKSTYTPFDTAVTPNGWTAGPGMFVCANYRTTAEYTRVNEDNTGSGTLTDYALQMQGNGLGYVQFVNRDDSPRGIEELSFVARIGQFINFSDFAYYDAGSKTSMSNYTVVVAGAFDRNRNKDFRGNASLSLIAHYRPGVGCYEFRVEQIGAKSANKLPKVEAGPQGQRFSFYRWSYDSTGKLTALKLGSKNNYDNFSKNWPAPTAATGFQPLYFSVSNSTAGVCLAGGFLNSDVGVSPNWVTADINNKSFNTVCYIDNTDEKLTSGTYGFLTTNSEGCFAKPVLMPEPASVMGKIWTDRSKINNTINQYKNGLVSFVTAGAIDCYDDIVNDMWHIPPGRMVADEDLKGLKGVIPKQTIKIFTAPAGTTQWDTEPLLEKEVSGFGKATDKMLVADTVPLYTTGDCSVKIAAGGALDDARTDIVIDTIEFTQFRGGDWEDAMGYNEDNEKIIPDWKYEGNSGNTTCYTNFIFTTAWVEDGGVRLSARRTIADSDYYPVSIRSPLYDNAYGRGSGLGMMSFKYRNAHEDMNLLVQVATNVTSSTIANVDVVNSGGWTTVTNFSFKGLSNAERLEGTRSCYIGMHGVRGLMRILVDPALVESCKNEMSPSKFPEIVITDVFSRDEPVLDYRAWWGWNLRTLGDEADGERKMYLYDHTSDLAQRGMSLALNNSVTDQVDTTDGATYKVHQPFLQTPTFATNVVGEIQFKARKYDLWSGQPAQVTLYGSLNGALNSTWVPLQKFIVSNETYTTYSYKTSANESYAAFRLGVSGVPGVESVNPPNQSPEGGYLYPVRVLIDEVLVSEAIRASIAFRGVGAFRNKLDGTAYVPNVPSASEQPLSGESWGVQCEIFAAQLEDEIDFEFRKPVVKLHWFEDNYPWGFENWRTNKAAKSAVLARATGTNNIYRSSYKSAPDAVVPASLKDLAVVQYELEVIYYTVGSDVPQTNYLSKAGSWFNPPWYKGVDYNKGQQSFSAYTILDTVAPGWAWINEANILGEVVNWKNGDADYQYVEIAVPAEASIKNWSLRFLESINEDQITTNTAAIFGVNGIEPRKPNLIGMESNMVFRVIGSPASRDSGRLKYEDGTLDGVWNFDDHGFALTKTGTVLPNDTIGVQLVRASGIIEHEIAFIGENTIDPEDTLYAEYHPTNIVRVFNRHMPGSDFLYVGDDDQGEGVSLSVLDSRGETRSVWFNDVDCTPGRINKGQNIDPDHPTPNGSSIIVYANLDAAFGHIRQTVGDAVLTNANVILVIPKGSLKGTNITYTVDKWYELSGVTTNGVAVGYTSNGKVGGCNIYTATVGVGASNNVTVVAGAKLDERLVDYGLTPDNSYRNAVIDWLEKGTDAYGNAWANRDSDEIHLAEYRSLAGTIVTNLTLTQMYWLDMDPTVGDLALYGGMVSPPTPLTRSVSLDGVDYIDEAVNFKMGVKLFITNTTDDVTKEWYNKPAWAPYVLRGRQPGETTLDYATNDLGWTNVTFKITGFLNNGLNKLSNKNTWIPLRWFVFVPGSFDENFTTDIEIKDPFGTDTPGYSAGWYDWVLDHPDDPVPSVFFSWSLDTRMGFFPVEVLKEENYYDYE